MEKNYMYEKVSDNLYWMGNNVVMRFNVVLGHRSTKTGNRVPFHQEYRYESNRYKDCSRLVNIKRSYDYFITIENLSGYTYSDREYIIIGAQDYLFFKNKIHQAASWLSDSNIYMYKDNNIVKVGNVEPIVINFLAFNKTITLEPIVMRSRNDLNTAGIRITLGKNQENFTDLTVDNYMGLLYIVDSFNMPMAAMMILNYIGMTATEGNVVDREIVVFSDKHKSNSSRTNTNGKIGRFVGDNKPTDNIDDL